jgi:hypothetical protein
VHSTQGRRLRWKPAGRSAATTGERRVAPWGIELAQSAPCKFDDVEGVESVVHRVYDSFGNVTKETNAESVDVLFGYTGRQL